MCNNCNWENSLDDIDELLADDNISDSGVDFLESVRECVEENKHITESQADAVDKFLKWLNPFALHAENLLPITLN